MAQLQQVQLHYEPILAPDRLQSRELVEESIHQSLPYGTLELRQWCFEGIRIRSARHQYYDHFLFEKKMNWMWWAWNLTSGAIL